jgi:hypothetical protein
MYVYWITGLQPVFWGSHEALPPLTGQRKGGKLQRG